ncbi:hypothetical protein EV715DRAFT_295730 [Schizophyllum commune]
MQQVIQVNVVNVVPLPPGCDTKIYTHSLAEWKLQKVRHLYSYSLQMGAWCLSLEQGFGHDPGCTDLKLVRSIRRAIRLLEAVHLRSSGGDMGRHNLLFPMRLSSLHSDLRAKVKAQIKDPAEEAQWRQSEAEFEGPAAWSQKDEIVVRYHVGEDMGQARDVVRRTTTVLNMYIPANAVSWLVSQDLDPGKSDLYLRLENGALVKISWWETIPAPLPGAAEEIHLEVHARCWPQRPVNVIRPIATAQCVECEFYALHSAIPLVVWLPVLEGGWVIPSHYRDLLAHNGLRENAATLIVHGEPRRTKALKPTTLSQPVAVSSVPARASILVWRALCAKCYVARPQEAFFSTHHFC